MGSKGTNPVLPIDASPMSAIRILHVIESYGAGSAGALRQYVRSTPDFEHHIIMSVRDEGERPGRDLFATITELPNSRRQALAAIRRAVATIQPSVVHAHSSLAGAFTRLAVRSRANRRIVYTPHCFAFERLDVGLVPRAAFALAEFALSVNTDVVAACAPREQRLAARMLARHPPVYVPNTAGTGWAMPADTTAREPMTLVSVGRLSPQKDPRFFAQVVAAARRGRPDVRAVWVGDGAPDLRTALSESGIEVTGWVTPEVAQSIVRKAAVYVHTAQWEGFPLSVLEAVESGTAVVARRIPSLAGFADRWTFTEPADGGALALGLTDEQEHAANLSAWRTALRDNTVALQRSRLLQAYGPAQMHSRAHRDAPR
jgi:glycosyltransferase involved in cell wall biosynthesis